MKKLRKTILALAVGCTAICAAAGLAACDEKVDEHAHVWDDGVVTNAATCEDDGVLTFTCTVDGCGETYTDSIDAIGHEWGEWSVTKKPKSDEVGEVTAECTHAGCTKTHTAELPMTYAITYKRTADNATCEGEGSQHYVAEIEGKTVEFDMTTAPKGHVWTSWKITAPTDTEEGVAVRRCAVDGCEGKEEHVLPVTGSDVYEKKTVPATCETDGHEIYNYEVDADNVLTFTKSISATGHVYGNAIDTTDKNSGDKVGYVCEKCGALGKELTYYNSDILAVTNSFTAGSYYCDFSENGYNLSFTVALGVAAVYEFNFEHFNEGATALVTSVSLTDSAGKISSVVTQARTSPVPAVSAAFAGIASLDTTATQTSAFTFDTADYVGGTLSVKVTLKGTDIKYIMDLTLNRTAEFGSNQVAITDGGCFVDTYKFLPESDGVYSLTVPLGMVVLKDGDDFIIDGTWANFEAKSGMPVEFTFSHDTVGNYTVLIGDEIVAPKLTVDGEPVTGDMVSGSVFVVEVGDDVEEGTYTLEITGNFLTGKATGYGYLYFMAGGDGKHSTVTSEGLLLYFPSSGTAYGYNYDCSKTPWTVTLTLKAGDTLYFTPSADSIPAGNTIAPISVTLKTA